MSRQELIEEIIKLHRQTNEALRQYVPETWIGLDLTICQLKSLIFIDHEECTNFKKLAKALGVTPSNVTGIADRLVEHGLVSRQENPDDRRVLWLRLTEEGKAVLAKLDERKASRMAEILNHMYLDELSSLANGFRLLVKASMAHEREAKQGLG